MKYGIVEAVTNIPLYLSYPGWLGSMQYQSENHLVSSARPASPARPARPTRPTGVINDDAWHHLMTRGTLQKMLP